MPERKAFKNVNENSWLAGVCGGIAYAFGIPVILVRICVVILLFGFTNPHFDYVGQIVFWFYVLAWVFGSEWKPDPKDYEERTS